MNPTPLDSNSVRDIVRQEFDARRKVLLKEVRAEIENALKGNQKVMLLSGQQKDEKKSHWWDVTQIGITALVGLGVFLAQSHLSNQLAATSLGMSTRYALTQEYYKKRFETYQRTYERLSDLQNKFMVLQRDKSTAQDAISAKDALDRGIAQSELYYSPEVLKALNDISFLAGQIQPVSATGSHTVRELTTQIQAAKSAMYEEVTAGDIGRFAPNRKGKELGR